MNIEWTDNTVFQFISEYKQHPILWDTNHEHHKSTNKKNNAWWNISNTMNISVDDLKYKITSLLASYRRERRKCLKKQSELGADGAKGRWFAYKAFAFLNEIYSPRRDNDQGENTIEELKKITSQETPPSVSNSSTSTPEPVQKKKKYSQDLYPKEVPTRICMNCSSKDESDEEIIAKCWALKLKRMTWEQRVYAEKFINEILLEGELGSLDRHSIKINESPDNSCAF